MTKLYDEDGIDGPFEKAMARAIVEDAKKRVRCAYVAVIYDDGHRLGIAREGEAGYYQVKKDGDLYPAFPTHEEASVCAWTANERLGLSAEDVADIVCSTMRKA